MVLQEGSTGDCHGLSWGYWTKAGATEPLCGWYRGMLESSGCLIAGEALGVENVENLTRHQIPQEEHGPCAVPGKEVPAAEGIVASTRQLMLHLERRDVASFHWCVHIHMHVCMCVCQLLA